MEDALPIDPAELCRCALLPPILFFTVLAVTLILQLNRGIYVACKLLLRVYTLNEFFLNRLSAFLSKHFVATHKRK